ncbi:MAG: acyl carrier protein [Polyangiaceae bacterium]
MSVMAESEIRERVRAFIGENFYVPDMAKLGDGQSLVETGIVDSTGILEVLAFIEEQLHVEVADAEAIPANLDSIQNIVGFVARKSAVTAEAVA